MFLRVTLEEAISRGRRRVLDHLVNPQDSAALVWVVPRLPRSWVYCPESECSCVIYFWDAGDRLCERLNFPNLIYVC